MKIEKHYSFHSSNELYNHDLNCTSNSVISHHLYNSNIELR